MKRKHRRLMLLGCALMGVGAAAALVLTAFEENVVFFYSPTDIAEKGPPEDRRIRIGGLVEEGSVTRVPRTATVEFRVTDMKHAMAVRYTGILPDLFRECQGVVANGTMGANGVFVADEILAKHDENYMPTEVSESLKEAGEWQEIMDSCVTAEANTAEAPS